MINAEKLLTSAMRSFNGPCLNQNKMNYSKFACTYYNHCDFQIFSNFLQDLTILNRI
jgi:hypothetical protein